MIQTNSIEHGRIAASTEQLIAWLVSQHFQGIDPHDALKSPFLGALGRRNRYLGILAIQLVRRAPFNVRPLLGITPGYNPKAMGLFLASFVRRYTALRQPIDLERAHFFAGWLRTNACGGYRGASWGYNFDWANRDFYAPRGTPTLVNTAFNGQALCDYAEMCDAPWAFDLARAACEFILSELHRCESTDGICFSYTPHDTRYIHNANMLGAALLARVSARTGERELMETARRAAAFTVAAQAGDGSWQYGTVARDRWVDNFHTGFVLGALADVIDLLGCSQWECALQRGYAYWQNHFFRGDGAPKYYPHAVYPIDAHSIAEAALLWLRMRTRDADAADCATRELVWGIEHFQDAAGFFYYQITAHFIIRIPYLRWSNAWMLRAQAEWLWGERLRPLSASHPAANGVNSTPRRLAMTT